MVSESLTIGTVAKQAGVGVETIRFYQREELIIEPPKPVVVKEDVALFRLLYL